MEDQKGKSGSAEEIFAGGGEMGERMRAFDWSRTPLGAVETWPQSLKTAVRIMLTSRQPIWLGWGEQLIKLYNDPYKSIVGGKHPDALGQPASVVWREIWEEIGPMLETAMGVEGTYVEEQLLIMERYGFREETYYTYSYTPIPNDKGGTGGIICANTDETAKVIGRRRLQTLRELGERTLEESRTAEMACRASAEVLSANPFDLPFSLIYVLDDDGKHAVLAEAVRIKKGDTPAPESIEIKGRQDIWNFDAVLKSGEMYKLENLEKKFGALTAGAWANDWTKLAVVLPLAKSGVQDIPAGFLVTGLSPRLVFDDEYLSFLDLVSGHIATAIANARAYDEEKKRAEALAEIDRAKTEFFSNVSHEFRTPLTLMIGNLEEVLARNGEIPEEENKRLESAHRNSLRLLKMVNTLLDFSRIEAGRQSINLEPVDLSALTTDLASNFRSAIESAGLKFIVNCPQLPEPAHVDREMWEKIVLNLISNAFKFTLEGEIEVSLRAEPSLQKPARSTGEESTTPPLKAAAPLLIKEGSFMKRPYSERASASPPDADFVLTIRDTGVGIPEKELPHIFERFHRVNSTQGRTHEGTGIGLALVKELVKMQDGTISVESEFGKGSTFTVSIPKRSITESENKRIGQQTRSSDKIQTAAYLNEVVALGNEPVVQKPARSKGDSLQKPARSKGEEVYHPAAQSSGTPEFRKRPYSVRASAHEPAKILLADDNADMREYVQSLLRQNGYEVITARDGLDALEAIQKTKPDLILSDVMMPNLDGFGLLGEIRANELTREIPVVMLSARAGEESKVEGLEAGADDYLVKPFSAKELLARVDSNLKLTRLRSERKEAEQALLESQMLQAMAMRSSRMGAWEHDLTTGIVNWNPELEEIFGLERGSFGQSEQAFLDLIDEEDRPIVRMAIQWAIEERRDYSVEFRYRHADGSFRWMEGRGEAVYSETGQPVRLYGIGIDITERKLSEANLERYQLLSEQASDIVWLLRPDGHIVEVNNAAIEIYGYTREELLAMNVRDLRAPSTLELLEGQLKSALVDNSRFETVHIRKDGTTFPVEVNATSGDFGGERLIMSIVRDITARKQAEREIRTLSSRNREILESVSDAFYALDTDWRFTYLNSQADKLLRRKPGDLLGRRIWEEFPALSGTDFDRAYRKTAREQTAVTLTSFYPDHNRWYEVKVYPAPNGITVYFRDVTEREQAGENQKFLFEVAEKIRLAKDADVLLSDISAAVGQYLKVHRCLFNEIDLDKDVETVHQDYCRDGESVAGVHRVSDYSSIASAEMSAGQTIVNRNSEIDSRTAEWFEKTYKPSREISYIAVPLLRDGKWVASLWASDDMPRDWSEQEIGLLETVAERTWLAVEKLHSEAALRERRRQLDVLAQIGQELILSRESDTTILQTIFERVSEAIGAELCFNFLLGHEPETLRLGVTVGVSDEQRDVFSSIRFGEYLCGRVAAERKPIVVEDMQSCASPGAEALCAAGVLCYAGFPLLTQGRLIGTVAFATRERECFREGELQLIQTVADQVAATLERSRLFDEVRESKDRFAKAFNASPLVVTLTSLKTGRLVEVNDTFCEVAGYSRDEAIGKTTAELGLWESNADREKELKQLAEIGQIRNAEYRFKLKSGEMLTSLLSAEVVEIGGEKCALTVIQDITDRKKAEQIISESEERYRIVSETASDAIIRIDENGIIEFANSAATRIFGYSNAEMIGQRLTMLMPEDLREKHVSGFQHYLATGERKLKWESIEVPARHKNGRHFPLEISFGEYNREGKRYFTGIARDITERKRAEEVVRESEQRLQQLADAMPQVVWVADAEGYVNYYNHRVSEFFNVRPGRDGVWKWQPMLHPDDLEATSASWLGAMAEGSDYSMEHRLKMADGSFRWHLSRAIPVKNSEGRVLKWYGSATDIHEMKLAQDRLIEVERRAADDYQKLLSRIVPLGETLGTARDLVTIYRSVREFVCSSMSCSAFFVSFRDAEKNERKAAYGWGTNGEFDVSDLPPMPLTKDGGPNSQAVFGRKTIVVTRLMDEMKNRPHILLEDDGINPNSSIVVPMMVMDRVIGTLEVQAYEEHAYGEDHVIALEMAANLAAVGIENVRLLVDEAKARAEAEAANRTKDEFLSIVSHELRTPLNAMLGWVRMLRTDSLDREHIDRALEVIERNTRLQSSLIEDLLDVTRIISGNLRIEKELIELTVMVKQAAESLRPLAVNKGVGLEIEVGEPSLYMDGDSVRLQQVVTNLVQNAIKFTPMGGRVIVRSERIGDVVRVSVEDTGIGIESEMLPYIFDRFRQEDASTRRGFAGLGLGLTIVKNIVELHGGRLEAASGGKGKGATFTVELPLSEALYKSAAAKNGSARTEKRGPALEGARILLVDDDVESLLPLQVFLERERATVSIASSAKQAIGKLTKEDFHILASDIAMPETDGYQFISQIRKKKKGRNSQIKAVAMTAYSSPDDRERALAAGFDHHFPKPLDLDKFVAEIEKILFAEARTK